MIRNLILAALYLIRLHDSCWCVSAAPELDLREILNVKQNRVPDVFSTSKLPPIDVVLEVLTRDDLEYDDNNHVEHNYIMFSDTPICRKFVLEIWQEEQLKGVKLAGFDVTTEYGKEWAKDALIIKNILNNKACTISLLGIGTQRN